MITKSHCIFLALVLGVFLPQLHAQNGHDIALKSSLPGALQLPSPTSQRIGFVAKAVPQPVAQALFAPFFRADQFFTPSLILQNIRKDLAITVRPAVLIGGLEIPLDPVKLAPNSASTISLKSALAGSETAAQVGAVVVRYDFPSTGAISAVVESDDAKHGIYLASLGNGIEEFMGTTFEGVFWAPNAKSEGFISLLNASSAIRTVTPTAFVDGETIEMPKVTLGPLQTRLVQINNLVTRSTKSGAGIRLEFDGKAGDIRAEGFLMNPSNGFSKRFQFTDSRLSFAAPLLRTNLFMLGTQSAADGFPGSVSFRSVAVVRNLASSSVTVTPNIKYLQNGALRTVSLKPIALDANSSTTIDFSQAQKEGSIPQEFHQGTLEIVPDVGESRMFHPTVIGELFNFNGRTGGFVVGPSFTARASRGTTTFWRTDGTFQTALLIENTADQGDDVNITVNSITGIATKTLFVPAGGLLRVSVKDLQFDSPSAENPLTSNYGTVSIQGSHGKQSAIATDRIIYSANEADYLGFPSSPCDYITGATPFLSGNSNPFTTELEDDWSDGSVTDDPEPASAVSNSAVAQLSGSNVTFEPPDNGSSVNITFDFDAVSVGCGGCSTMTTFASFVVSGVRIADAFWKNPTSSAQGCFYSTFACIPPSAATCKSQVGISFAPSGTCPSFAHTQTLVIGGVCIPPSIGTSASGPGVCN